MSDQMTITVRFHQAWFMSQNDRPHWAAKNRLTGQLRRLAQATAHRHPAAPKPCLVDVLIHRPKGGQLRDAENAAPTIKALIDGFRDAHVLVDDDHKHVVSVHPRIAPKNGATPEYVLEFAFIPQEVTW